jgi:hypothetical protein
VARIATRSHVVITLKSFASQGPDELHPQPPSHCSAPDPMNRAATYRKEDWTSFLLLGFRFRVRLGMVGLVLLIVARPSFQFGFVRIHSRKVVIGCERLLLPIMTHRIS